MQKRFKSFAATLLILFLLISIDLTAQEKGTFELSNGIKVIYQNKELDSSVVSLGVYIKGGSSNITQENQGVESLLLKMMLRGSKNFSKNEIDEFANVSRTTYDHSANYEFSKIYFKSLSKYFPKALEILADGLKNPTYPNEEFSKIKKMAIDDLKKRNLKPDRKIWHVVNKKFLNNHPYYKIPEGRLNTVKELTPEDLEAHRKKVVNSGHMFLVYVGDLSKQELKKQLQKYLSDIPRSDYNIPETPSIETPKKNAIEISDKEDLRTAYIVAKFFAPSPDDSLYYPYKLATSILTNRLKLNLRTKHHLTYSTFAGAASYEANWGYMYATASKPNKAVKLMKQELEKLKNQLVPRDEMKRIVNRNITYHYMKEATTTGVMENLGWHEAMLGGWEEAGKYLQKMDSVTPKKIKAAMNKYVNFYKFGVITNKDEIGIKKDVFLN